MNVMIRDYSEGKGQIEPFMKAAAMMALGYYSVWIMLVWIYCTLNSTISPANGFERKPVVSAGGSTQVSVVYGITVDNSSFKLEVKQCWPQKGIILDLVEIPYEEMF